MTDSTPPPPIVEPDLSDVPAWLLDGGYVCPECETNYPDVVFWRGFGAMTRPCCAPTIGWAQVGLRGGPA